MTQIRFDVSKTADSISFVISSTLENIDSVCEKATEFLRSKIENIQEHLFSINLVIREGLTNAVRHGNRNDPEKEVRFLLKLENDCRLKMVIEDQGKGFDWKKQKCVIPDESEDHGRGVAIMGAYFSGYSYNEKGNILFLEKDISASPRPVS